MHRPLRVTIAAIALGLVLGTAGTGLADQVLLHQSLPVDQAGRSFLLVDRSRISHATATKAGSQAHTISIRIATEPPVELEFTCNDEAITRQVLQSLRPGAIATLDVTGRCRL